MFPMTFGHGVDAKAVLEEDQVVGSGGMLVGLARTQNAEPKVTLAGQTRLLEDSQPSVAVEEKLDRKLDSEEGAETLDPHSWTRARGEVEEAHES